MWMGTGEFAKSAGLGFTWSVIGNGDGDMGIFLFLGNHNYPNRKNGTNRLPKYSIDSEMTAQIIGVSQLVSCGLSPMELDYFNLSPFA